MHRAKMAFPYTKKISAASRRTGDSIHWHFANEKKFAFSTCFIQLSCVVSVHYFNRIFFRNLRIENLKNGKYLSRKWNGCQWEVKKPKRRGVLFYTPFSWGFFNVVITNALRKGLILCQSAWILCCSYSLSYT